VLLNAVRCRHELLTISNDYTGVTVPSRGMCIRNFYKRIDDRLSTMLTTTTHQRTSMHLQQRHPRTQPLHSARTPANPLRVAGTIETQVQFMSHTNTFAFELVLFEARSICNGKRNIRGFYQHS